MKLSPASRIGIEFGLASIVVIGILCASVWTTFRLKAAGLSADRALNGVNKANDLHQRLGTTQRLIHDYLVSGDLKRLAALRPHTDAIKHDLAELRDVNRDDAVLQAGLDSIESMTGRVAQVHDRLVPTRSKRALTPSELLGWYEEFSDLMSRIHYTVDEQIESRDRAQLAGDAALAKAFATRALITNCLGGALAIYFMAVAAIISVMDARARGRAEDQLRYQASHDALTGLPNRFALYQELEQLIGRSRANGGSFAVLLIDLDRFKAINDSFGHHYGDLVLKQLRPRLSAGLRMTDFVARLGGDEFAMLLPDAGAETAMSVADRIGAELRQPIEIDGFRLEVGASIGIALFPQDGQAARELFQRADGAMYASKRRREKPPAFRADPHSPASLLLQTHQQAG